MEKPIGKWVRLGLRYMDILPVLAKRIWLCCSNRSIFLEEPPKKISVEVSIWGPQDSTSTNYLAAKTERENALVSIGRIKKRSPLSGSWRSHYYITSLGPVGRQGSFCLLIYINKNIR